MINIWNTLFYEPLYNGLVFLVSVVPFADVGIAVVALTLLVKIILLPFSHKSVKTQSEMKRLDPEIKEIKKKYEKDKQEQARKTMELYKQHGLNPFSGCLMIFIQIPVIFALYWIFWKELALDGLNMDLLYSFTLIPEYMNMNFLGLIDMQGKSYVLALIAGVSQYFQIKLSMPQFKATEGKTGSFKDDLMKSMNLQMRYVLPIFVFIIAYTISAAVALYWATSNLFSVGHELLVKRKAKEIQ